MAQKRVLIITYYWPPSGGSGVQRWVYFSKYLKRLGVEPVILTVDPAYATYPSLDDSLEKEVEGIEVIRTKSFEPLQLYSKMTTGNKQTGVPYGAVDTKGKSLFQKMSAFVRGNIVLPDARKYWKRYAYSAALDLINKGAIDLIISTGPPHSTHLIAQALKKHTGLPWIADFRDPWTEVFYNKDLYRTNWAIRKDEKMEKGVIQAADAVLCVSAYTAELVQAKTTDPKKVSTIINGYDHELFQRIPANTYSDFTITYVGYLGRHHAYQLFVDGISAVAQRLIDGQRLSLRLAGRIDTAILEQLEAIPNCTVVYEGVVDHEAAIAMIKGADLLLISIPVSSYSKGIITGKLMEYIATGNPILLVGEQDSDAAKILNEFPGNLVLEEGEVERFAEFCAQCYSTRTGKKEIRTEHASYTREATARQLKELIHVISDKTTGGK